jgi:light-regulated signal transduction histidine kinase (bacteriophytochrome)
MQPLDLSNCDREPINIPGSIQPHGILLVIDPNSEVVLQAAGDTTGTLASQHPPLGRPVHDLLGVGLGGMIHSAGVGLGSKPLYLGAISGSTPSASVDVLAHMRDDVAVLELESGPANRPSVPRLLAEIGTAIAAIETAPDLLGICQAAAREVRRLTGFDRVMVYRFLEDGSGSVVAEHHVDALPPFLNHRYPASDIPRQARELYVHNPIRLIPDVCYVPVPLVPSLCPATGQPLDMRDCMLRSVSPTHIRYLRNMGVAASMSVSVTRDGALWGLVACHHRTPKHVPYELREVCKHLGQALAQRIAAREAAETYLQVRQLDATRDKALSTLARAEDVEGALLEHISDLQAVVPSDGVAVCHRGRVAGAGFRPSDAKIRALINWLLQDGLPDPFATDRLAERHAPASTYRSRASGLVATVVWREEPLVLLWFRAEQTEEIDWAGNPHKPVEPGSELGTLNPRSSFELWREIVRGRSRPWTDAELEAVHRFRNRVLELYQRQRLSALNQQLREALSEKEDLLAQKDLLMREVHHRVQNGLQLVNSMLRLQEREAADPVVAAHFSEACRRLTAVALIHQRLRRSDQVQTVDFDSYLRELQVGLVEGWGAAWDQHIRIQAAPVMLSTKEAVILALVVTELLTNAVKHAYGGKPGSIRVTVEEQSPKSIRIAVEDHGMWVGSGGWSDGVGSRLVRALLAPLKGKIGFEDNRPGLRVVLEVPFSTRPG